jgi:hypothetical protein
MRKILLSILVLTHYFLLAQQKPSGAAGLATVNSPPDTWRGVFAGSQLNYLSYYDKITTIEGNNAGFRAGVFYQKNIDKHFAIQPELLFSIRGGKIHDIDSTVNVSLLNIELPINFLFLYKRLQLGGGPNFCYSVKGTLKSNGVLRDAFDVDESFERTLKRFEFGGNFMIAYTFSSGLFLSLNFSPGFTNIYEGDGSAPAEIKANTRVWGISLGYTFSKSAQ